MPEVERYGCLRPDCKGILWSGTIGKPETQKCWVCGTRGVPDKLMIWNGANTRPLD